MGSINPFPGLRSFEANEDHLFFGREDQIDELLRRLGENCFLAVVGTSGSGKSSLVKAGLLPSLYSGFMMKAGSNWRVAVFRPGGNPIRNLARSLNQPNVLSSEAEDTAIRTIITETTLRRGSLGLVEVVRQARMPSDENLLIVVDQFEELFRLEQSALRDNSTRDDSADEAAAFVKLLLEATRQPDLPIYVVLTMRSDYLGDCARFRDLPEAINDSQYLIPRMTRDQRQLAIAGPVAVGGAKITPRLVNRLLNNLGDNPDQLPILQHALMRTWDYWTNNHKDAEPIDLCHYEAIGGMAEALSQHADEIYHDLGDARSQKIAEKLFKCLTDKGPRNLGIRHPTRLKEVCDVATAEKEEVIAVVEQFRGSDRSFLMPPANVELDENTVLDISHESLMRVWGHLNKWVDEERQSAQIYRRLAETSALYHEGKTGLLEEPELTIDLNWCEENKPNAAWAERYEPNFESAMHFLEESKAARDEEVRHQQDEIEEKARHQQEEIRHQKDEIEIQKRASRNLKIALTTAITGCIVAIIFGAFALEQYRKVKEVEIRVFSLSSQALYTLNQEFDALLEGLRARSLMEGKLLKFLSWGGIDTDIKNQVVPALQQAIYGVREQNRLEGHQDWVIGTIFSPDGQTLVSASYDKTVKLWRLDGSLIKTLEHSDKVSDTIFSPDGQTLASASWDKTVKLWRHDGTLLKTLTGHQGPVYRVSFSPDGKILASASADNTVRIWKRDGKLLRTLKGHSGAILNISFSPDGQKLASASADNTVKLWRSDGTLLKTLTEHQGPVSDVSFSRDSQTLASASWDKTVKLWRRDGTLLKTLTEHQDSVYRVSFNPNGQILASASADNTIKLWKRDGTLLKTLTGHVGGILNISFSSDGQKLASASYDSTVKLWRLDGTSLKTFTGHGDQVQDVSFSPDGQMLASASADKTVKLWKLGSTMSTTLIGHNDWVSGVSFSPDDQTIASTSRDKTVKLWKRDGTLLNTLTEHTEWVQDVSFSPDSQTLASASWDKTVKLWKRDGSSFKSFQTLLGHKGPVSSVSFSRDGQTLASAGYDSTVKLWRRNGTSFKLFQTLTGHEEGVVDVDFSRDDQMLASASNDKTVELWKRNGTSFKLFQTLEGHSDQVFGVSFSPDGQILASASRDTTVKLWKRNGTSFKLFQTLKGHQGPVFHVSFSPDSQIIASASNDKTVKLWKHDGTLLTTLLGHGGGAFGVIFSPKGQILASSSNDRTVILWKLPDASEGRLLDDLVERSCEWVRGYLKTNPNVRNSDRHLCDGF